PTKSERIFEVMFEEPFSVLRLSPALAPLVFSLACWAAACAARRAAAMKLDEDTGSRGVAGISLIAFSEAAMRSDGVERRPLGRVPGSSGVSGGSSGSSAGRGAELGTRISLIASGGGG